ncbi:MAG TPA: FHIPEP family type III secretion protein [Kofleriaceae bacterium]|nr:FHIPEP family type III secretion protein [Kofleriaceae bacterium]
MRFAQALQLEQREADFHGAMDGASKFVSGDAIAGLLVLAVNVVGGIVIGVAQKGMSIGDAARSASSPTSAAPRSASPSSPIRSCPPTARRAAA